MTRKELGKELRRQTTTKNPWKGCAPLLTALREEPEFQPLCLVVSTAFSEHSCKGGENDRLQDVLIEVIITLPGSLVAHH